MIAGIKPPPPSPKANSTTRLSSGGVFAYRQNEEGLTYLLTVNIFSVCCSALYNN